MGTIIILIQVLGNSWLKATYTFDATWGNSLLSVTGADSSQTHHYLQDHLGSPIRLLHSGSATDTTMVYDEFGVLEVAAVGGSTQQNGSLHNPFGYTGYQTDNISGLYYAQARFYDPTTARFTAEDVVRDGANWYAYCHANPLSFIDPTGLVSQPNIAKDIEDGGGSGGWASPGVRNHGGQYDECDGRHTFFPTHIPSGWGTVSDFLYDLDWIFGSTARTYTDRHSAIIQVGLDNFMTTGEFFFDGRIGTNIDGRLFMNRTDFYQIMGIGFEQRVDFVTSRGTARHVASLVVGVGVGYATAGLGVLPAAAIGSLTTFSVDGLMADILPEPGNYMFITTDAFIWNPDRERYHVIRTEERLVWGNVDAKGNQGWVVPPRGPHISNTILW